MEQSAGVVGRILLKQRWNNCLKKKKNLYFTRIKNISKFQTILRVEEETELVKYFRIANQVFKNIYVIKNSWKSTKLNKNYL